ncbi:MAG TPA: PD-(D/E)XK nuclease family protein, partial [Acidimicrobiia bacterium]
MGYSPPWSLSPSACSSFKSCPLAFRFSYLERLPEPPSPWTSKGTLVHRALELLLDRPADERTLDAALADLTR